MFRRSLYDKCENLQDRPQRTDGLLIFRESHEMGMNVIKGFAPAVTQEVHEQKMGKSYQNEHARQCPPYGSIFSWTFTTLILAIILKSFVSLNCTHLLLQLSTHYFSQ
jgi:hypothetical protein